MNAPAVPLHASIQVRNGSIFWTAGGDRNYIDVATARSAISLQTQRGGLPEDEARTLLDELAKIESRSGKGVAAEASTFGKAAAKAEPGQRRVTAAARSGREPTLEQAAIAELAQQVSAMTAERPTAKKPAAEKPAAPVLISTPWQNKRAIETFEVDQRPTTDLKGQSAANTWLQEMGSRVHMHVARVDAKKPSDIVLSAALIGPEDVGRKLAAEIYTGRLYAQRAISEPKLHVIDLRRLLDDGGDLEECITGLAHGVVLIENAHILDRDVHAKELRVIEALSTGNGEPVLLLSGEPELRGLLDSHWRLKEAFKSQVVFKALSPEVLTTMFVDGAKADGYTLDAEAREAVAGRFRSSGKAGGAAVKSLLTEAKNRLSLRLFPDGELPETRPTAEDLSTFRVVDVQSTPLGNVDDLASIIKLDGRIGQAEAKAWARRIAMKIAADREAQAKGLKVEPLNLNIIITGDQGTGKTSIVEFLNELLVELGVRNGKIVYKTASEIKGKTEGEGESLVRDMYRDGEGGIVCLDETHVLTEDDLGRKVLKAMMPLAYNMRETTTTILIGYEEPLRKVYDVDPGMGRRFPKNNRVNLPAYNRAELKQLVHHNVDRMEYELADGALDIAMGILDIERNGKYFGNAGAVENLVESATTFAATRTRQPSENARLLMPEDFGELPKGVDAVVAELDRYVGLDHLKPDLAALGEAVEVQRAADRPVKDAFDSFALLVGPTGSGRKTVAGILSRIYSAYGLIGETKPVMRNVGSFKGTHVGESENNVREAVDRAIGSHLVLSGLRDVLDNLDGYARGIINELKTQLVDNRGRLAVSLVGTDEDIQEFLALDPDGTLAALFAQRYEMAAMNAEAAAQVLVKKLEIDTRKIHPDAQARLVELMDKIIATGKWQNGLDVESLGRLILTAHSALRKKEGWQLDLVSLEAIGTAVSRMIVNKGGKALTEIWDKAAVSVTSPALRASRKK